MNYPRIEESLLLLLEKLYKQLPYDPKLSSDVFTRDAAFAAGQVDVVNKLRMIYEKQQKDLTNE